MKRQSITPQFVDYIPEAPQDGILYISERYAIAVHLCCCGCREEVVTPLSPADWHVTRNRGLVSLLPSIGNWSFSCQSHYWIKGNSVLWTGKMSAAEIAAVKENDRRDKAAYIARRNEERDRPWSQWIFELAAQLISRAARCIQKLFIRL
jgi:hypothetical protein